MITAKSKDGKSLKLVYKDSFLMADKDDELTIDINIDAFTQKMIFKFSDEGTEYNTSFVNEKDSGITTFTLHKWYSFSGVEISEPYVYETSETKEKFYLRFRSTATEKNSYRKFEISIWKKVNG